MDELAYVNGDISPVDDASVPVRDRGFIFGDGVYDVARVYGGRPSRLGRHIERLRRNAGELEFASIPPAERLREIVDVLLEQSDADDAMVYMQLTRGVARRASAFPDDTSPTVYVSVESIRRGAGALRDAGASAMLVDDIRWARNDIKTVNLLPKVMMGERARAAGCYEALYVDDDGHVWEGTSTNLFAVTDGVLVTPPLGPRVLPGTTREDVITLARDLDIVSVERRIRASELTEADEVFVTGTLTELLGLVDIDGTTVGDGTVGPVTQRLHAAYVDHVGA